MKVFMLKFGKYKGQNFFETPTSYQDWLLKQDWFEQVADIKKIVDDEETAHEKKYQENIILNQEKIDYVLNNGNSIIGKKINAYAWQYDNSGSIVGTISNIEFSEIQKSRRNIGIPFDKLEITVFVSDEISNSSASFAPRMNDFKFNHNEFYKLLIDGKLPKPNKFLNSGKEAEIN